jgi:transcriptional regulator of acetoin/glycerol metabolism
MRELVSVLQVALALAGNGPVGLEHLPAGFLAEAQVPLPVATEEADLHTLVEQANGNLSAVARGLGISRTTLYKRLRER